MPLCVLLLSILLDLYNVLHVDQVDSPGIMNITKFWVFNLKSLSRDVYSNVSKYKVSIWSLCKSHVIWLLVFLLFDSTTWHVHTFVNKRLYQTCRFNYQDSWGSNCAISEVATLIFHHVMVIFINVAMSSPGRTDCRFSKVKNVRLSCFWIFAEYFFWLEKNGANVKCMKKIYTEWSPAQCSTVYIAKTSSRTLKCFLLL